MKKSKILLSLGSVVTALPLLAPILTGCACYSSSESEKAKADFVLIRTSTGYCIDGLNNSDRSAITEIYVPETIDNIPVVEISKGAFKGCINLKKITLPFIGHTKSAIGQGGLFGYVFGDEMYEGCGAYTWQEYSDSDEYDVDPEDFAEFAIPSSLKEVVITNASKISSGAFSNCKFLDTITFTNQDNIKEISNYAFYGCMALKNFNIPSKIEIIGRKAFARCYKLKSIEIPNTCTTVKHNAFSNCIIATKAVVPSSVVNMGKLVFENFISGLIMVEAETIPATWDTNWVTDTVSVVYGYSNGGIYYTNEAQVAICGKDSNKYAFLITWLGDWETQTITIPGTVTCGGVDYKLKKIGPNVFSENTYVQNLNISENVEEIGANAFEYCTNLKTVNFPSTLKTIGTEAFIGCDQLGYHTSSETNEDVEGLYFNQVETIGTRAFYNINGITKVNFGSKMTNINESAFERCEWLTPNRTKEEGTVVTNPLIIPSTVRYIGKNAFKNIAKQSNLTDSTIYCDLVFEANEDITIDESAFESIGIKSLTGDWKDYKTYKAFKVDFSNINVKINDDDNTKGFATSAFKDSYLYYIYNFPKQIEVVQDNAFRGVKPRFIDGTDKNYRTWTLPATLTSIGYCSFYENNYCKFVFEDTSANAKLKSIGNYAFYNCSYSNTTTEGGGFEDLTIPDSVETIGSYAFAYCTQLRTVHIPVNEKLTRLEAATFHHCEYLGNNSTIDNPIVVPANITYLGSSCFSYCYKLKFMTVEGEITTVGSSCFAFCTSFDGGTSIETAPLKFVKELGECTSFGSYVYQNCSKLSWVPFPNNQYITSIASGSFSGCTLMSDFLIPASIATIGAEAFKLCKSMTKVTGMQDVANIGENAFQGCSGITVFEMNEACHTIQSNAFKDCTSLGKDAANKFILPANITQAYVSTSTKGMGITPFAGWDASQTIYFRKQNLVDEYDPSNPPASIETRWGWTLTKDATEDFYTCEASGSDTVKFVYYQEA